MRRRADLVFPRPRVAVYVDGCFWHSCPQHATVPKTNTDWWLAKLEANRLRDRNTDAEMAEAGWRVIRVWEHMTPSEGADLVEHSLAVARDMTETP